MRTSPPVGFQFFAPNTFSRWATLPDYAYPKPSSPILALAQEHAPATSVGCDVPNRGPSFSSLHPPTEVLLVYLDPSQPHPLTFLLIL